MYAEVDGKVQIKFGEPEVESTLNDRKISELMFMAPEMFEKDSKPVSLKERNQY